MEEARVVCEACGWSVEGEAWEMAAAARLAKPVAKADGTLPLWTLDEILAYQPDPANQIWPGGILTAGDAAAIVGAPGVGKSRLALQAAVCTILGRPFLGWETRGQGKRWLFLQTENNGERLKYDLQRMTALMSMTERQRLGECLRVLKIDTMEFGSICMVTGHPDRERIEKTLEEWKPDIVVVDPLRDAGRGDPNKDEMMMETCQSISEVIKRGAPQRVPLIIHHGRTGAVEAAKVWGDDAASFGRNSKVLYGWLRSQINVAAAGVDHPDVVIVGCGKCSNGRKWEPFAARLCERTMHYLRLSKEEFDLEEWAGEMGGGVRRKPRKKIPAEDVAAIVAKNGGKVRGGVNAPEGLVSQVKRAFDCTKEDAITSIEAALGETLEYADEPRAAGGPRGQSGGHPVKIYYLKQSSNQRAHVGSARSFGDDD